MPQRKYVCIKKCYYLSRLWYSSRGDNKGGDILETDRTDVPEKWFKQISGPKPRKK